VGLMGSASVGRARVYQVTLIDSHESSGRSWLQRLREDSDWRGYARRRDVPSGTGSEWDGGAGRRWNIRQLQ